MIEKFKKIFLQNTTLKATVFKNFMWLATSNITSRIIKAALTIYAARALGAAGYGVVSYTLGLAGFFLFFKNIGVDVILTREVAKKTNEQHFYFSTAMVIEAALLVITVFLLLFVAPFFGKIPAAAVLLPYVAIMIIADDIRDMFIAFFRGKEQMEIEALVVVVGNISVAVFGFLALLISPTPIALVMAYAGASLTGAIAATSFLKEFLWGIRKNFQKDLVVPILRSSLPILFASLGGIFMYNVDVIMLGWWRTASEIGWYSAAQKIVGIVSIFPGFIATATYPAFSRLFQEKNVERLQNLVRNIVKINFLIVIPMVVGGLVLRVQLVDFLFGSGYAKATVPLAVFIFSLLASYQTPVLMTIIFALDKQVSVIWYAAVASISNILLSFFLIRSYGMLGAAIAGVVVALIFMALLWRKVSSLTKLQLPASTLKFVPAALLMGGFALVLTNLGLHVLLTIFLSGLLYFGLVQLMGEDLIAEARSIIHS